MTDVQRIYLSGWTPADFVELKPNTVLLEPIVPDVAETTKGGLYIPGNEVEKIPGTAARLFKVVGKSALVTQTEVLDVKLGDVVYVRNAMLDPMDTTLKLLTIEPKHVLAVVERGPS